MPQDLLTDVLGHVEKTGEQEKHLNHASARELQVEQTRLAQKQSRLADLLIDGNIARDIYEAKNREIQRRRQEIERHLKQIEEPTSKDDRQSLGQVITRLSNSEKIFARSKTEQNVRCSDLCFRTCGWKVQPLDIPCENPSTYSSKYQKIHYGVKGAIRTPGRNGIAAGSPAAGAWRASAILFASRDSLSLMMAILLR